MSAKSNNITAIIKEQIKNYGQQIKSEEVGKVLSVGDGIAIIAGLQNAMLGELLEFDGNVHGLVLNLEEDAIGVVLMGSEVNINEGSEVRRTKRVIEVPVGDALVGRVIDSLGQPLDNGPAIATTKMSPVMKIAPGVMSRVSVSQPLETGLIAIDAMIPIGRGQRELIIGDRQTGKTAIAIDTIINQRGKGVHCVYVAIGQKNSSVAQVVEKLKQSDAMTYTTVISTNASELAPLQYLAPYTGVTIAEEWMKNGKDVLVVYDDLSKHAVAYRTMSLLLRRPPGREAYPGDVFYLHSQLLERAARVNKEYGGGSITALPIIETQAGDISAYIPTNVISITDGQIFTMTDLFNSGQRPAIDAGLSVSRVGSAAQIKSIKQVSGSLKLELANYNEMAAFAQFGSDLDPSTKRILTHGEKVLNFLKQNQYSPLDQVDQAIILLAINSRIINIIPADKIGEFKQVILNGFKDEVANAPLRTELATKKAFDDVLRYRILSALVKLANAFVERLPNYDPKEHEPIPKIVIPAALAQQSSPTEQMRVVSTSELTTTLMLPEAVPASPVVVTPPPPSPVVNFNALNSAQPVSAQPVSAQPVSAQPVSAQPVSAQPVSAQPVSAQPVSAQPVSAQPVSAQPVSAQPVSAQPVSNPTSTTEVTPALPPEDKEK